MTDLDKLPLWLCFTGQSGAGKEEVIKISSRLLKGKGVDIVSLSSGNQIRECIATGTYMAKRMKEINDQALLQPAAVSFALTFMELVQKVTENTCIIQEGSPRSVEQFEYMLSVYPRLIPNLKIIEILTDEQLCKQRLIERTKKDLRSDLTTNGEPDLAKISTKMAWWNETRVKLVEKMKQAGVYSYVENNGTLEELEKKLEVLLS